MIYFERDKKDKTSYGYAQCERMLWVATKGCVATMMSKRANTEKLSLASLISEVQTFPEYLKIF